MRARRGFTILEIVIAMAVLAIALLALMSGVISSMRIDQATREQVIAKHAATAMVETMRRTSFTVMYASFNAATSDDPVGPPVQGCNFAVTGLEALTSDADGMVGKILFPETSNALDETIADDKIGMPTGGRDLNGDGDASDTNVNADYTLLPVRIVLEWDGVLGYSKYEITTYMAP